jgi:hypothetical protein
LTNSRSTPRTAPSARATANRMNICSKVNML